MEAEIKCRAGRAARRCLHSSHGMSWFLVQVMAGRTLKKRATGWLLPGVDFGSMGLAGLHPCTGGLHCCVLS